MKKHEYRFVSKGRLDAQGEDRGVKIYIDSFSEEKDVSL